MYPQKQLHFFKWLSNSGWGFRPVILAKVTQIWDSELEYIQFCLSAAEILAIDTGHRIFIFDEE